MGWRMDKSGAALYEGFTPDSLRCRDEELDWLETKGKPWALVNGLISHSRDVADILNQAIELNNRPWKQVFNQLGAEGVPTALSGGFAGLELTPASGVYPTITFSSAGTETAAWATSTYTPTAANPQAPKAYRLDSFGVATTPASQGTLQINIRYGQLVTSPLVAASVAAAQTASSTSASWQLIGTCLLQAGGGATTGKVVGGFRFSEGSAVSGGSAEIAVLQQVFNSTAQVSVETDAGLAGGLWVGWTIATSTTSTETPLGIIWASWN